MTTVLIFSIYIFEASAQDIVVEATRLDEDAIETSRTVSILDSETISTKNNSTVADLLREVPGLDVARQGGAGQTTSIFIRGARSEHTLVLVDGIEANDAMSPSGGYDFSSLSPHTIERIEVYRGPQSVRFGSGALGGVVNIVTKEGRSKKVYLYQFEGGTYDTNRANLIYSGETDKLVYVFGADRFETKGFSAAKGSDFAEPDGTISVTTSSKISYRPRPKTKFETVIRYLDVRADIDTSGGPLGDDVNSISKSDQLLAALIGERRFLNDQLKSKLGFYYNKFNRHNSNSPDSTHNADTRDNFKSENQKIDLHNQFDFSESSTIRGGLNWRRENGNSESFYGTPTVFNNHHQTIWGGGVTYLYADGLWYADFGYRYDEHAIPERSVSSINSYRFSMGRSFFNDQTKITTAYGTGFKIPSLYQLYSSYGNINLKSESSSTLDLTLEQKINQSLKFTTNGFYNRYRNLIEFDPAASTYFNIAKSRSYGAELQASYLMFSQITWVMVYHYLEAENEFTGQSLLRRPRHSKSVSLQYADKQWEAAVQYLQKGKRSDVDPVTFNHVKAKAYEVFAASTAYKVSKEFKLTMRGENIFNSKHEEVAGYSTTGPAFYIGFSGEI